MPNGEWPEIKLKDFQAALEVYLNRLEKDLKSQRKPWETVLWNLPLGKLGPEDVDDIIDRLYWEIMDTVTEQGMSPHVLQSLSPDASAIYEKVVRLRSLYPTQQELVKQIAQQTAEDWDRQWAIKREETGEKWRQYGAQTEAARFQWQQQEAQRGWDWREQEAKQAAQGQMWEQERTRQNQMAMNWEAQARRFEAQTRQMGQPQGMGDEERARIFEAARSEILAGLTGPENWIKRWEAKEKPNRWAKQPPLPEEDVRLAKEEHKKWKAAADIIRKRYKDPEDPLYIGSAIDKDSWTGEQWRAYQVLKAEKTSEEKELEMIADPYYQESRQYAQPIETGPGTYAVGWGGGDEPRRPTTPSTPAWLRKMYPSLGANLPEQGAVSPIAPVSGQAWGKLSPSQRAGWMGYAEYTGAVPKDVLWQSQQMLPKQPRVPTRWAAARQWA